LVVHTSSRAVGWVAGGAAAVVDALLAAVGPEGTVTMPAHSADWGDPAGWQNPPVPSAWWADIVEDRPAFDPYSTPLRAMGAVAENLLMRRATVRSGHPLHSHMACGRHAATIVQHHPLHDSFGDESPLGRLYELGAKVLLIGVGHGNNTSLHLAEARAQWPGKERVEFMSKVMTAHGPQHVTWLADDTDGDDFERLGEHLDSAGLVTFGMVGQATTRLADMRALVDHAVPWFEANRR
jgi:aminoglycoside 3-N-acetyltransferase